MKNKDAILSCLKKEFELRSQYFNGLNTKITTIYFGGGTPSVLNIDEINALIEELSKHFNLNEIEEITFECNPDDLTIQKLKEIKNTSINRLSIGIQSFRDVDLTSMNRAHNSKEALQSVRWARDMGFDNITIDLIYGFPNMTLNDWQFNLDIAEKLNIPHLSCYALTVEKKTSLHHFIQKGIIKELDEKTIIEQFDLLMAWADQRGMLHYEISNFANTGYLAKHNTNYWKDIPYIGFGPSAHSYNGNTRSWNVANNSKYIKALINNELPIINEQLGIRDKYNEYVLKGLRTIWGIKSSRLNSFGNKAKNVFMSNVKPYINSGHIRITDSGWVLTQSGKYLADRISSDLFWCE